MGCCDSRPYVNKSKMPASCEVEHGKDLDYQRATTLTTQNTPRDEIRKFKQKQNSGPSRGSFVKSFKGSFREFYEPIKKANKSKGLEK